MRLVLVDDDAAIRKMLTRLIERKTTFHVVGEASDGAEAIAAVELLRPDVVVMDVEMPVMDGIKATEYIKQNHPGIKVLAFTSADDDRTRAAMYEAGAIGFVSKGHTDELVYALHYVP